MVRAIMSGDRFYDAITDRYVGESTMLDRVVEYGIEYLEAIERGDLELAETYQAAIDAFQAQSDAVSWDDVIEDAEEELEAEAEEDYGDIASYFDEGDRLAEFLDFDISDFYEAGEYEFSFEYEEAK